MLLDDTAYAEAVEKEQIIRDAAFLPVNESIGGFLVRPLTLQHLLVLRAMRCPFLRSAIPAPLELAAFLWLLSPEFSPASDARVAFLHRCSFVPPRRPLLCTKRAVARWERKAQASYAECAK